MKIVLEVDSDADYWLLPDGDVSIIDIYAEVSHEVKLKAGLFDVGLEDIKRARLQKCSSALSGPQKGKLVFLIYANFVPSIPLCISNFGRCIEWMIITSAAALSIPYCCGLLLFAMLHGCILLHVDPETALYTELWRACAGSLVTVPREGERMFYFPQGHIEQHLAGHDLCETSSGPDSYPNRSTGHRNSCLSRKVEKEKGNLQLTFELKQGNGGASLDLRNIYLHDSKKNDLMFMNSDKFSDFQIKICERRTMLAIKTGKFSSINCYFHILWVLGF
ncbi:hypothetical protein ACSBR2_026628 [Camellia fascicularis]